MALELGSHDGKVLVFRGPALVGRVEQAALRLDSRAVSGRHAELRWTDDGWAVRDLGSTNGTFVDGRRLEAGEEVVLAIAARLGFATPEGFTVQRAAEPRHVAVSTDGQEVVEQGGVIAIPDEHDPLVTVVSGVHGWGLEWADGRSTPAADGDRIKVNGTEWTIWLPQHAGATSELAQTPFLHDVTLSFRVSRDEEHVRTTVSFHGQEHVLPSRTHHYTLLTLARCRLADREAGELPEDEQGWVLQTQLERMLAVGHNVVYKHIFRSRREFSDLGIAGSSDIVERRPAAGQLRLGVADLKVDRA